MVTGTDAVSEQPGHQMYNEHEAPHERFFAAKPFSSGDGVHGKPTLGRQLIASWQALQRHHMPQRVQRNGVANPPVYSNDQAPSPAAHRTGAGGAGLNGVARPPVTYPERVY